MFADGKVVSVARKAKTNLKALRERKGWSRNDLVWRAKTTYQTVTKWETKELENIDAEVLESFLNVLKCEFEDLVYFVDVPAE